MFGPEVLFSVLSIDSIKFLGHATMLLSRRRRNSHVRQVIMCCSQHRNRELFSSSQNVESQRSSQISIHSHIQYLSNYPSSQIASLPISQSTKEREIYLLFDVHKTRPLFPVPFCGSSSGQKLAYQVPNERYGYCLSYDTP